MPDGFQVCGRDTLYYQLRAQLLSSSFRLMVSVHSSRKVDCSARNGLRRPTVADWRTTAVSHKTRRQQRRDLKRDPGRPSQIAHDPDSGDIMCDLKCIAEAVVRLQTRTVLFRCFFFHKSRLFIRHWQDSIDCEIKAESTFSKTNKGP